jgi:hypothetical protein
MNYLALRLLLPLQSFQGELWTSFSLWEYRACNGAWSASGICKYTSRERCSGGGGRDDLLLGNSLLGLVLVRSALHRSQDEGIAHLEI